MQGQSMFLECFQMRPCLMLYLLMKKWWRWFGWARSVTSRIGRSSGEWLYISIQDNCMDQCESDQPKTAQMWWLVYIPSHLQWLICNDTCVQSGTATPGCIGTNRLGNLRGAGGRHPSIWRLASTGLPPPFCASRGCNVKLISLYVFVGNLMICIFLGRLVTFKHEAAKKIIEEWSRSVDHCSSGYFESTAIALVCFL